VRRSASLGFRTYNEKLGIDAGPFHKAVLIYNPYAGRLAHAARLLQRTIEVLDKQGLPVKPVPTRGPNTGGLIAREEVACGADLILAAGGDGTINEVANGLVHTNVPMAILPAGTANVLAHELRVKLRLDQTAAELHSAVPTRVAVGRITKADRTSRYFLMMVGVGLDAQIVYDLNLDLKAFLGKMAYYLGGFVQIGKPLTPFRAVVDGGTHETTFALVTRVRNYGGDFEIARAASLLTNEFEVVLFNVQQSYQYVPYLVGMMLGQVGHMPGCRIFRAQSVHCEPLVESAPLHVDGEYAGRLPVSIDIVPNALTLMLPKRFLERERLKRERVAA
jgi:YegS/Rv2252/BmrU family lipid kinase